MSFDETESSEPVTEVKTVDFEPQDVQADIPDENLRAWLVVLGSFLITAVTVGLRYEFPTICPI
jgi:hypothetical protein